MPRNPKSVPCPVPGCGAVKGQECPGLHGLSHWRRIEMVVKRPGEQRAWGNGTAP